MWLFDTCVISELRKMPSGRADAQVVRWTETHPLQQAYLSAITVKELVYGVLLVERRDHEQGRRLRDWFDTTLALFDGKVLPVDEAVAIRAAGLHVPDPAPEADTYIAATALVHGLRLATRNTSDFSHFSDLVLVNPWQ